MNEVVNKYLLTGDKSMPELHLRQRRFIYSACGPFTKHCKRILNLKKTSDFNKLDKACLTHDAVYVDSKYLAKMTVSDKVLKGRAYEIALNSKYVGYQRGLTSIVFKFFDKKIGSGARATSKTGGIVIEVQAQELHKPLITKFRRKKCIWSLKIPFELQI